MADQNPTAPCADSAPANWQEEAVDDESLVLDRLLTHWPILLQEIDLERELSLGDNDFEHRDRVDIALHRLYSAGLATRCGGLAIPTRAALRYRYLSREGKADL